MVSKGIPKRCWSLTTLRRLEEVALPKLDRCLQNDRLLIHVCEVLLNSHRHLVGSAEVIPNDGSLQIFFVRWWLQPERTTYKLHNTRFTFKFLLHIVISQCFSWCCTFCIEAYMCRCRPEVTYKAAILDCSGLLWPMQGCFPGQAQMLLY